jgi:hypothetical protein
MLDSLYTAIQKYTSGMSLLIVLHIWDSDEWVDIVARLFIQGDIVGSCVISGFCCHVNEIFALQGCYAKLNSWMVVAENCG